ncbi:MAG: rhomboid family intramembrane serine protease [Candidatus Methanomethylicia archaeon]
MSLLEMKFSHRLTIALIAANLVVYLVTSYENLFLSVSDYWVAVGSFSPSLLLYPSQWYRVLTSMFMHADIFHIFFNMYFLFFTGRAVEEALGSSRFGVLYFLSGVAASIFHSAFSYIGGFTSYVIPTIGASGAISGVLGAYLLLYPGTSLIIYIPIFIFPIYFPVKASIYIIFWFATQVIYGYAKVAGSIAVFAHAGGFLAGSSLLPLLASRDRIKILRAIVHSSSFFKLPVRYLRGLSPTSKIILNILTVMLILGGIYIVITTPSIEEIKVATVQYSLNEVFYTDYISFNPQDPKYYKATLQETRILLNRLIAADLLYDVRKSLRTVEIRDQVIVTKHEIQVGERRETVNVENRIQYFRGVYDKKGFLTYAEGKFTTSIIYISRLNYYLSNPVTYMFNIDLINVDAGLISKYTGLISLIISISAQLVFTTRDKELSIVAEE